MTEPSEPEIPQPKPPSGRFRRTYDVVDDDATPHELARAVNVMNAEMGLIRIEVQRISRGVAAVEAGMKDERLSVRSAPPHGWPVAAMLVLAAVLGALALYMLIHALPR